MAEKKCSVEGCKKKPFQKGFCSMHYSRLRRHGNLDTRLRVANGETTKFLERLSKNPPEECVIWPHGAFGISGYGCATYDGRQQNAHRISLIIFSEQNPSELQAAHLCGVRLCVNPKHLVWATRSENDQHKRLHGTYYRRGRKKLNHVKVEQIRKMLDQNLSQQKIADRFGVAQTLISHIKLGKIWVG